MKLLEYWFDVFFDDVPIRNDIISYDFRKIHEVGYYDTISIFQMKQYSIININENIFYQYFDQQVLCLHYLDYEQLLEFAQLEINGNLKFRKIIVNSIYFERYLRNLFLKGELYHADFSMFFDNQKNEKVESIKVYSDFVEPRELSNIHQLNHLHTLLISIQFHEIINIIAGFLNKSDICRFGSIKSVHKDNIIKDWELMIESFKSNKSLNHIK
ncbi:hypothetical protein ACTFIZ_001062 [Dictyostelium cf. discoideum]